MPMPVSATPNPIHSAAAAAIVHSTNNTRVRFHDMPLYGHALTNTNRYFYNRVRTVRVPPCKTAILRVGTEG